MTADPEITTFPLFLLPGQKSMGVRFACHACGKQLNIKSELAGRRGICPGCSARFRIPLEDAEQSTAIDEPQRVMATPTVPQMDQASPDANRQPANHASAVATNHASVVATGTAAAAEASSTTAVAEATDLPAGVSAEASPSLDLLVDDPSATWYVRPPSGGQYGPATGEILKQWINEGRVASNALLWRDGWPQWREATDALPEIAKQLPDANTANGSGTTKELAPQDEPRPSVSQPSVGEDFGYEDSDFAARSQPTSYGGPITEHAKLKGRDSVGSDRRAKASKRTLSIVVLALVVIVLIAALAYVMTR